jgi:hypothetical protein
MLALLLGLTALLPACAADKPFTVVVLPDTQVYCEKFPDLFHAQTRWIRDNAAKENVVFATHVGDIVQHGGTVKHEWETADKAMSALDGVVPWAVAIGNHDYDDYRKGVAGTFVKHFGPGRFAGKRWYGGASDDGLASCQFFTGGGRRFMILHLPDDANDKSLAWAAGVLDRYPDLPTIVTTHIYLAPKGRAKKAYSARGGANSGEQIWHKLIRRHPQIFLVLSGHFGHPSVVHQVSTNDAGGKVMEILADFQAMKRGGDGWLVLLTFVPTKDQIEVRTYSPVLGKYRTDPADALRFPYSFVTQRGGR